MPKKDKQDKKVTFETIKDEIGKARQTHKDWYEGDKGMAKLSYEYRETLGHIPKGFPTKSKIFLPINLIKEAHDHKMGIYLGSDPECVVTGRGKDFKDRERGKFIKALMNFVFGEAKLEDVLEWILDDYDLPGMGCVRARWDPYQITSMETLGMLALDYMPLNGIRLDPRALHPDLGRFMAYEKNVNRQEFGEEWGDYYQERFDKKLNVEKMFRVATQEGGLDYDRNKSKDEKDKVISVIHYEYWRKLKILLMHPETGETIKTDAGKPVYVPKKEYRLVIAAGDQVFSDELSPLSELKMWTIIYLFNSRIHDMPFSQSDFLRQRYIQDAINTFLSMLLQSEAKEIQRKRLIMKGTVSDMGQLKESSDVDYIEWDAEGIPPGMRAEAAIPKLEDPPAMNTGAFQLLGLLLQKFEDMSITDVLKGKEPTKVQSGKAISLLQQTGLQPYNYHRKKLNQCLGKLGAASWHLVRKELTDEMELPITEESGEPEGIPINKVISTQTLLAMKEAIQLDEALEDDHPLRKEFPLLMETADIQKKLEMITIRDGEDRVSIDDWAKEQGGRIEEILASGREEIQKKLQNVEFVLNDVSYGNFDVRLTIDPLAEQTRMEKLAQVEMVFPIMQNLGAPMAAFKYLLKTLQISDRADMEKEVKEESPMWQAVQQMMEQQGEGGASGAGQGM